MMYEAQSGRCAICGTINPGQKHKNFAVDHDHISGAIRGLLCKYCNTGLGAFRDSEKLLSAAINYLLKYRTSHPEEIQERESDILPD
jgi:hypothetical protein